MFQFRCRGCGTVLRVPDQALGRRVACSTAGCDAQTRLPTIDQAAALPEVEFPPPPPPSPPLQSGPGFFARRKLRRQVQELEAALETRLREIGAVALDPLPSGGALGQAAAEITAADAELAEARANLNAVADATSKSSIAADLRREVDRRVRERDAAIARLGRQALDLRERVAPEALAEIQRLEALIAERRDRLHPQGEGARPPRLATIPMLRKAMLLLVLFGSGWGGFTALESLVGPGPPPIAPPQKPNAPGVAAPAKPVAPDAAAVVVANPKPPIDAQGAPAAAPPAVDPVEASVCLVAHGWRITQVDGAQTELLEGWGTGFAITPDGFLLTNGHVVTPVQPLWDAARNRFRDAILLHESGVRLQVLPVVWVFFGRDRKYEARLVDYQVDDADGTDVCLLKIDRPDGPCLPLSGDPKPARGLRVKALGFPDYAAETLTGDDAIRKRMQTVQALRLHPSKIEDAFKPDDFEFAQTSGEVSKVADPGGGARPWIFHTAPLSHGSSGGPLISDAGVAVGINTRYARGGGAGEIGPAAGFLAQTTPQFRALIEAQAPSARWVP